VNAGETQLLTARNVIIDTGILTLFFSGDSRVQPFFRSVEARKKRAYVTSVNLSEYYYKTCQTLGEEIAGLRYHQCRELLEIVETNRELSLSAGKEKCHRGGNLSIADCFALAATKSLNGTLLTTDPELSKVEDADVRFFEVR
jgi:predicted nucleic acid-binding protein